MKPARPNFILITLHDLGRQIESYDPALPPTPALTRLAGEGAVFENHFTTCPLCSPARASIITGRYPHSNGMNGLTHRGFALNPGERTLAHRLGEAGYLTALEGLHHETEGDPRALGYQEVRSRPDYSQHCYDVVPRAIEFLRRRPERPFLLAMGFTEVHRDYRQPGNVPPDPATVKVPPFMPDTEGVRRDLAAFYGMVAMVDRSMGPLLDALDETGLSRDTLLLFTTDHGAAFPRAKSTLFDPGIGVTLLARWPGVVPSGARVAGLTSHADITPTLMELAGLAAAPEAQGRSFARALREPAAPLRECVFAEKSWHGNEYDPMRCIRTDRFKYIRNFTEGWLYQIPLDIRRSESAVAMDPARRRTRPMEELYDLQADPCETRNLADSPADRAVRDDLRARLERWMKETGDPLPDRHIPWPQPGKEHFLNNMACPMPMGLPAAKHA
jgi:arylsulfatase A-like enzyme